MAGNPKVALGAAVGFPAISRVEGTYEIEADQVTDRLAINQDLKLDAEGDVNYRKTWNVTFIPTGIALIRGLPTASAAKAAARLLEAAGYDDVTAPDRQASAEQFMALGVSPMKAWVAEQNERSRSAKSLVGRLDKQTRAIARGDAPAWLSPTPQAQKAKKAPKKAAKRKAATKPKAKKGAKRAPRREREVDLLALARKARGNPTETHQAKERLLNW